MSHPFPQLLVWPNSGLTIPWSETLGKVEGTFDASFGPEGVGLGMVIYVYWANLADALKQILGYSWRDTTNNPELSGTVTGASNAAPIQITSNAHGLVTGNTVLITGVIGPGGGMPGNLAANGSFTITRVDANNFTLDGSVGNGTYGSGGEWRTTGSVLRRVLPFQHPRFNQLWAKAVTRVVGITSQGRSLAVAPGGGAGQPEQVASPRSEFFLAALTVQFWRPPYNVRTDSAVFSAVLNKQCEWFRYVSREWEVETQMLSREGQTFEWHNNVGAGGLPGSVGQKVSHSRVKRTWYQIPEAALFQRVAVGGSLGNPDGAPINILYTQTKSTNPVTGYIQYAGAPLPGCVNTQIGGLGLDLDPTRRLWGARLGTLMFENPRFIERPLHLPPELMQIGIFGANEPIAQKQYDVELHFDLFDPPRGYLESLRGHNLMPWTGDALWYSVQSQKEVLESNPSKKTTPFQYADLTDIFNIL